MHVHSNSMSNFKSSQDLKPPCTVWVNNFFTEGWVSIGRTPGTGRFVEGGVEGVRANPRSQGQSRLTVRHFVFQNWGLKGFLGCRCRFLSLFYVLFDTNKNLCLSLNCRSYQLVVRGSPVTEDFRRGHRWQLSQGHTSAAQLWEF